MLIPVNTIPGICKAFSSYASGKPFAYTGGRLATGRFVDGDKVRFVAGFAEKIGGWVGLGLPPLIGIPRGMRQWRDNAANPQMAIGTERQLYRYDGTEIFDITPVRPIVSGNLTNPLTTTVGSPLVEVADNAQALANGDWVFLSAAASVGGLTVSGWYPVSAASATRYEVTLPTAATSSVASAGGQTAFQYPRMFLINPFTTTAGSASVMVLAPAHGAKTGDYVTYSGASPVDVLTLNGEFQLTVVDTDHYTITASDVAVSSVTGGGTVNTLYDISVASAALQGGLGYGQGDYGTGPYGIDPGATTTQNPCWTLWPYGNQILACPLGGTIYVFDPVFGGRAHALANAPNNVLALLVTPERYVVALGTGVSGMQIAWADQNDYTNWTTTPTNTANSGRTLVGGSYLVGGVPVRSGVSLILSNRAAFGLSYTGDNSIYQSPLVADNAGLVAPNAIVTMGGVTYWMGDKDFWMYDGSVTALPTDDIREFVFENLNLIYASKCIAGTNRAKREVWFFYVSQQSTEIDSYVIYHTDQPGTWSKGSLSRTAWDDADLFLTPFGCDANGNVFAHETGSDADGQPLESFVTMAPTDISNGNQNMNIFGFIPDFQRLGGEIDLTITTRYYPQDADMGNGPFPISSTDTTPRIDLRADGKMVGFRLDSNALGADWRLGVVRIDTQPSGNRA